MDDNSICVTSVSERENGEAMCSGVASLENHNAVDKMSTDLWCELKIDDGNRTSTINHVQSVPGEGFYVEKEEEEDGDYFSEESFLAQMGYSGAEPNRDYEEEEENLSEAWMGYLKNDRPEHEPITTPLADFNLISAFKGSREKEGRPAKEHRVSWAPDVRDPLYSSESHEHFTLNKNERRKSEQKAKGTTERNKQKVGKSKDKKANKRTKKSGSDHGTPFANR